MSEEDVTPEEEQPTDSEESVVEELYSNLTGAVEALMNYYGADDSMLLTDYMIILVNQSYDSDGDTDDEVEIIVRDGSVPRYRIKGLIEEARDKMRGSSVNIFMSNDDEADFTDDGDDELGV